MCMPQVYMTCSLYVVCVISGSTGYSLCALHVLGIWNVAGLLANLQTRQVACHVTSLDRFSDISHTAQQTLSGCGTACLQGSSKAMPDSPQNSRLPLAPTSTKAAHAPRKDASAGAARCRALVSHASRSTSTLHRRPAGPSSNNTTTVVTTAAPLDAPHTKHNSTLSATFTQRLWCMQQPLRP